MECKRKKCIELLTISDRTKTKKREKGNDENEVEDEKNNFGSGIMVKNSWEFDKNIMRSPNQRGRFCSDCGCYNSVDTNGSPEKVHGSVGKDDGVSRSGSNDAVVVANCYTYCCCDKKWVEFTESTSLHGLRYIWLNNATWFRRILWLVLTLACAAIMMYQVLDRIIYYYEWPVTVNVKINFNSSLQFPSVTMCNQNAFRATRAEAIGRYSLITDMFSDVMPFNMSDLEKYNATDLSFDELYRETGHRKEDLIVSCQWRGEKCGPENFTQIMTDHGMCFTFNYIRRDDQYLFVDSPGSEDGLSLTLNVEQYEYMPGPNDAAGLKVLLHHPDQFPHVKGLGLVLPAGSHSFIGTKVISVQNLPRPHGQCSSPSLRHFRRYSSESCTINCATILLKKHCGCRLHYMPEGDDTPLCSLKDYYQCYKPKKIALRSLAREACDCPVPCEFLVFDTSVSYANTSPLSAERFLAQTNRSALKTRYDAARDVAHRLQIGKRKSLMVLVESLEVQFSSVRSLIVRKIDDKLQQQRLALTTVEEKVRQVVKRLEHLYKYQRYIVDKDFIRARDAMNERTFSVVALAMQEYIFLIENSILKLADTSIDSKDVRKVIYLDVAEQLDARIDITQRAFQNYTQLLDALVKGEPIFNYKYKKEPRKNSKSIVPLPLFHKMLNLTRTLRFRVRFMGRNLQNISGQLQELKDIAHGAYVNKTLNETELHLSCVMYLYRCRQYYQSKDMFLYDIPDKLNEWLLNREGRLQDMWKRFEVAKEDALRQVDSLMDRVGKMKTGVLGAIGRGLSMAKQFLNLGNLSKKQVAAQFLKEEVQETQSVLKNFFSEVRSRGHELFDDWLELERTTNGIWTFALEDVNLRTYYEAQNMSEFLINTTDKVAEISEEYAGYRNDLDLRGVVKNVDGDFVKSLSAMLKDMSHFKATEEIDVRFMQENILRLNIFYRELNYEQITQQEAYDMFALLCDIGGSMGLFLGASVMTLFELLDLMLFTYIGSVAFRRRRQ